MLSSGGILSRIIEQVGSIINSKITICNGKDIRLVGDTPNIEATNDDIAIGIWIVNI